MPTITWAENKGNGEVYLDWVNISDAKDYTLTYKVKVLMKAQQLRLMESQKVIIQLRI